MIIWLRFSREFSRESPYLSNPSRRRKYSDQKHTAHVDFYTCYVDHFLFIPGNSKKWKTETDNGGNDGLSTTMLVCLLAGIGGAILFIVMLSFLVKRSRSTGKGE